MKKLIELIELVDDNEECVVLKVKEDVGLDLICLGYFDGDEKMLRLTKGHTQNCTIWTENNRYSWYWGEKGFEPVTPVMVKRGKLIQNCIEKDLNIKIK